MTAAPYRRGQNPASRKKPGQLSRAVVSNTTGIIGVSLKTRTRGVRVRRFYQVCVGIARRKFPVESLGAHEAFRRAVAARTDYEASIRRNG